MNVRHAFFAALWLSGLLCRGSSTTPAPGKQAPPKLMLWSWYAEDDFRPMANNAFGVAYLALSLELEGQNQVRPSPRNIPVRISDKTYRMAVIRLDAPMEAAHKPAFSPRQRETAVKMIAEIASFARPRAVQIDFDAPRSAWPFYSQLLSELRARIAPDVFLSITALVSWCDTPKSWLAGLPVDEIVPMAFHMGQATPATVTRLQRGGEFQFPGCRASIGVDLGEPDNDRFVSPRKDQRAYFFVSGQSWSPDLVSNARKAFLP